MWFAAAPHATSGAWLEQRNALRRAIIAALILWVIGLLGASLNTYFSKLEGWLPWLLPNVVCGVVVVIGAVMNHVSSSGQQAEHARDGGQPPFAQSPIPPARTASSVTGVLAILLVLGSAALAVTVGFATPSCTSPVGRLRWPSGLSAYREDRAEAWTWRCIESTRRTITPESR
jgi:hypothetical protein